MCTCPDIDERLANLASDPSTALLARQAKVQRHEARPEREKQKLATALAKQKKEGN